jgi:hypothetical protein
MPNPASNQIAIIGIDIGKNSFHVVGLDKRGAIVLRQKWSRGQVEARLANMPPCLIGMEACVSAHPLSRNAADRVQRISGINMEAPLGASTMACSMTGRAVAGYISRTRTVMFSN